MRERYIPPFAIPTEIQFEHRLKTSINLAHNSLEAYRINEGDIISWHYESKLNFVQLRDFAQSLAPLATDDETMQKYAMQAGYRAMVFSIQLSDIIGQDGESTRFSLYDYIDEAKKNGCQDFEDLYQYISQDAHEYLAHRPVVDDLIQYYAPQIDSTDTLGHHVEVLAAFTLAILEYQAYEKSLSLKAANLSIENFLQ